MGFSTLCPDKPITDRFLDEVIGELAALTPGDYIHIGGDEARSTQPADYIDFVQKLTKIVTDPRQDSDRLGRDQQGTAVCRMWWLSIGT